jgi:glycosyltransferase involved in cell wall biosynthesis
MATRISLITVCFNSEATIRDTLVSVINQSYFENIEYILIDGKSNDNTVNIINEYSHLVDKFVSENDSGIYQAMNKGLSLATGELVGFINSDDIFLDDNVIENLVKSFNNKSFDIIYSNLYYVKKRNTDKIVRKWKSEKYYDKFFDHGNVPPHPTFYIKTECLKKMGLFNLNFNLAADYEFMFRALKKYKFQSYFVDLYTVKMRMGGATNMTFSNIFKQNIEILSAWKINNVTIPFFFIPLKFFKKLTQYFQ